jgi:para-aminobenzoate synthetase/4-amino-4-deoxychorismate lyase
LRVLRAGTVQEAQAALDEADRAHREGKWIAGYLSYELGAAFVKEPIRRTSWPLLALGIFDEPLEHAFETDNRPNRTALLAESDYETYARAIAAIRASIYEGAVYQVNYTVPFAVHRTGDPFAWWHAIARKTHARYQAYVEDESRRVLSWSPELFLGIDRDRIETRPMKGTAPLDSIQELGNAKNRAEHVMIVDLLRNDLHRVCNDVVVERLFEIERYPTFATMTSTIAGNLRPGTTMRSLFEATFPCGSVTGAPKRSAIAHIASLESRPRDVYCGSIGFLSPQRRGWWNVAIRTAQIEIDRDTARYDTGGGIVADSRAHDEWDEMQIKAAFLRTSGSDLELLETFSSESSNERIELHLARLYATAARFGARFDIDAARHTLRNARGTNRSLIRARLRLDGTLHLRVDPLDPSHEPVRIRLATQRVRSDDAFLRVKTSHRPQHDAAAAEAAAHVCFDALLRNERGELTEGTRTNLFVERDGALVTSPVACGLLPGILRSILVSEGRVHEAILTMDDVERADALYVGNSARGLLRATLVKDE